MLTAGAAILDLVPADARSVAVVGEEVGAMSTGIMRDRGMTLLVDQPGWAVLAADGPAFAAERLSDVPPAALDAVVVRRAWMDRAEARRLLSLAGNVLRSGGSLVAADVDAEVLLEGPTARYPAALLWRLQGAPVRELRASTSSPAVLSTDAVGAGFRQVTITTFDEMRGGYDSPAEFWGAVETHGWRGDAWLAPGRRSEFLDAAAAVLGTLAHRRVVDREPWFAVTGVRP